MPPEFRIRGGGTRKSYPNKDANIEYYTDERGNIRKRKKTKTEKTASQSVEPAV